MKLDGIIDNVYFKQSIRSNTDNVSENDMKNFIEFINKLFCQIKLNHFLLIIQLFVLHL